MTLNLIQNHSLAAFVSQGHIPTAYLWGGFGIISAGVTTAFKQIHSEGYICLTQELWLT